MLWRESSFAYRGPYKRGDVLAGRKYAQHVAELIVQIQARGDGFAGFIAETLPSVGGQIVLAVRQAHARLALELLLSEEPGVTVVGTASETEGLLALTWTAHPDLVVLEWGLPGRPAEAVLAEAHALADQPRFLVLGRDADLKPGALLAGACAFVLVGDPPELLLAALRQVRAALRG